MSEWITDRKPTEEDADYLGCVWTTIQDGRVVRWSYDGVAEQGTPWMPITPPEPYVKPKRWTVIPFDEMWWGICDNDIGRVMVPHLPTREAAERIADIYEEMLP